MGTRASRATKRTTEKAFSCADQFYSSKISARPGFRSRIERQLERHYWSGGRIRGRSTCSVGRRGQPANNGMPQQPSKLAQNLDRAKTCAKAYYGFNPLPGAVTDVTRVGTLLAAAPLPKSVLSDLGIRTTTLAGAVLSQTPSACSAKGQARRRVGRTS